MRRKMMKNTVKLLSVVLFSLVFLAACTSVQMKTYVGETKGINAELTYTYQGDEVIKMSQTRTLNYKDLSLSKAEAENVFNPIQKRLDGLTGVDAEVEYKDNEAVLLVDIDYDEADPKKVAKADAFTFLAKGESDVSMKTIEKNLKHSGYKEMKKNEKDD